MRSTWARGLAVALGCQALALAGCGGGSATCSGGAAGRGGPGGAGGAWQYTTR